MVKLLSTGFAVMVISTSAGAQEPAGLPDALQGIKPAVSECRSEEPLPEIAEMPPSASIAPDLACALPATQAKSLRDQQDAIFIDLRPTAEYAVFHIANALNLTLAQLRSKPYWRSKPLVLIGSGKGETEWYRACAALRFEGYKQVRVLQGGMAQWLAQALPVEGQQPPAHHLSRLSAEELWLESQSAENVVMLDASQQAIKTELGFSTVLPKVSATAIKTVLDRRRKELGRAPLAAVVLAVAPSSSDRELQSLQQLLNPLPLLVYRDAPEHFLMQMAIQKASWKARARGPKQPRCGA